MGILVSPIANKMRFSKVPAGMITGKRWGVRVDFNGLTDARLAAAVQTTARIINNGGQAVLFSHNGRPNEVDPAEWGKLSLRDGAAKFNDLLINKGVVPTGAQAVLFADDLVGRKLAEGIARLSASSPVLLTENSRFHAEEIDEKAEIVDAFGRQIVADAGLDGYVLGGFSGMLRAHATYTGIAKAIKAQGGIVPIDDVAAKEIDYIWDNLIANPKDPFIGLLGGAKVSGKNGKLQFLNNLLPKMKKAVLGGALLYPFLIVKFGREYAGRDPLAEIRKPGELDAEIAAAGQVLETFRDKLIIPTVVFDPALDRPIDVSKRIESDFVMRGLAAGPLSDLLYAMEREHGGVGAAIINGTMSKTPEVTEGTNAVLAFATHLTDRGSLTIAGGGDTEKAIKAAKKAGQTVQLSFQPTGGGAMLDLLTNLTLPAIEAASDAG